MRGKALEIVKTRVFKTDEIKDTKLNITDRYRQTWGPNRSVTEKTEEEKIRRANKL